MTDEQRYLAFLIRLWSVHANGDLLWRASAENVHTGERHAFADLTGLCDFLRAAVEEEVPPIPRHQEEGYEEEDEVGGVGCKKPVSGPNQADQRR